MATVKIKMLPSLAWAIWALIFPVIMAERHARDVEYHVLLTATIKFPRFFGEVTNVNRTGDTKVVALVLPEGDVKSMKCSQPADEDFRCDLECGNCATVAAEFLDAIDQFQRVSPPDFNDLTFIADKYLQDERDGMWRGSFFFSQTNLGGKTEIDNAFTQLNLAKDEHGALREGDEPARYQVYTGEFDHDDPTPSCDAFQARDTAEHAALNQPFWDALYPAKEYKMVYTVQKGRLYLTWRVTFNLKDKVGDDFIVWVNARNCTQIVAAAPAKMDLYISSLMDYANAQKKLARDRGVELILEYEKPSKPAL